MVERGGRRLRGEQRLSRRGRPLVTVITVVFNGMAFLEQTIESVLGQTYDNVEYVVIDGGSTDGTVELLRRYEARIDLWISEPDNGIYDAWNKGLALANGEWIGFLGADDLYAPDALAAYVACAALPENDGAEYVSSRVQFVSTDLRLLSELGSAWRWPRFQRYMNVAHVGSLHRRALFERYGTFDTRYRVCADYELLLRPRAMLRAAFLDRVTARMRYGGVSTTSSRALAETARAKHLTGGRPRWLCLLEREEARLRVALWQWRWRDRLRPAGSAGSA